MPCLTGNIENDPHIQKSVAKELNARAKSIYGEKCTHSEKMFSNKHQSGSHWTLVALDRQPALCQHTQSLLFKQQYILPVHEWLPVLQRAFAVAEQEPSASQSKAEQLVNSMTAILRLNDIAMNTRQHGISPRYINTFVSMHYSCYVWHNSSSEPDSSSQQTELKLPQLQADESELHFIYEAAVQLATPPTVNIKQHQVAMILDPCPCPTAQQERYVAIVRLPNRHWVSYKYDTGK